MSNEVLKNEQVPNVTRDLFEVLRKCMPGLPDNIRHMVLTLDVDDAPRLELQCIVKKLDGSGTRLISTETKRFTLLQDSSDDYVDVTSLDHPSRHYAIGRQDNGGGVG